MSIDIDIEISEVLYRPKKDRPKFSSTQIFVTLRKFCHLGPTKLWAFSEISNRSKFCI